VGFLAGEELEELAGVAASAADPAFEKLGIG